MSICFVSAFYELQDGIRRRNVQKYIEHISYVYNMGLPIVFFTDMDTRLSKLYTTMKYVNMSRESLPIWDKILTSNATRIAYGFDTTTKEYSALTISKSYFIYEAKIRYPDYDYYVWIDSGIASHGFVPNDEFKSGIRERLGDKIRVVQMKYPEPYEREGNYLLKVNKGIIAASVILVPKDMVEFLWDETFKAVDLMLSIGSLCLDEHVLAYINGKHMDKFDYWFSDYSVPHNIRYIRKDHEVILRNLNICIVHNRHVGCNIARTLLDTMEYVSDFPKNLIVDILYKIHHMSYYVPEEKHLGIPLHILTGKIIHYMIKNYSTVFPDNIGENLEYSGIDINSSPEESLEVMRYVKSMQ